MANKTKQENNIPVQGCPDQILMSDIGSISAEKKSKSDNVGLYLKSLT